MDGERENTIGGFIDDDAPTDIEGALQDEIEELAAHVLLAAVSGNRDVAARWSFDVAEEFIAERERRRGLAEEEL